jgi:hypothetical protein
MKTTKNRTVRLKKDSELWNNYALLGAYAEKLNRLPDAGQVRQNPLRSAPQEMTVMVF